MLATRRPLLLLVVLLAWGCAGRAPSPRPAAIPSPGSLPPAPRPAAPAVALPATSLSETQQALHVLNRLGYGPRPGDVDAVRQVGVAAWIDAQLHPERLDDGLAETRLAGLRVPTMTPRALMEAYPPPNLERRQGMEVRLEQSPQRMIGELQQARLLRAVESRRQLLEVMVDFWFNHVNVFAGKGSVRYYVPAYEREAIRPYALGRFRDLLGAVARHPAMLFYLDAWLSTAPDVRLGERRAGLNENYARELLELHTLGVDGGYTQADIIEVARAFTGWTIDHPRPGHPRSGGGYLFDARAHDRDAKTILGVRFPAGGGREEGERVLDIVARHPATARFIATKLARRFVADAPPPAVIERAAAVFQETDGDLRAVVGSIVRSPEFFGEAAYRAKVKTPLEFTASALRAVGADTDAGLAVQRTLLLMGQPLYGAQPPTGYADRAEAWASPGGLLARLNFAQALVASRLAGTAVAVGPLAGEGGAGAVADRLLERLLGGEVSDETRTVLREALAQPAVLRATLDDPVAAPDVAKIAALVLGCPEFQRR
ncbi:MAG TPA: DUF1800 domain-containing protein [Methylomirabilota bacterium]|nr:DUF1800 domain-containing protein [Methylomirabilota bacterium]